MRKILEILAIVMFFPQTGIYAGEENSTAAQVKVQVNHAELIENASRLSGVTKESIEMLFNKSPRMFEKIEKYLLGAKLLDQFCKGKDEDALWTVLNQIQGKAMDAVMQQICPSNLLLFIKAVKLYKAALELIHDFIFIPALDSAIYGRYRSARGGHFDFRTANPEEAFSQATAHGKYYPLKQKMYNDLVKSKDYNKEIIGKELEKKLWKDIDRFWQKKLEARYMLELIKKKRSKLEQEMLKKIAADLARIRSAAKPATVKLQAELFPNPARSTPPGLFHVKRPKGQDGIIPKKDEKINADDVLTWRQHFYLSDDTGFKLEYATDGRPVYKHPKHPGQRLREVCISILMQPRYAQQEQYNPKTKKMESVRVGKEEQFKMMVENMPQRCRFTGKTKKAFIMTMNEDNIYLYFVRSSVYCQINVMTQNKGTAPDKNFDNASIAKFFARVIASRIDAAAGE